MRISDFTIIMLALLIALLVVINFGDNSKAKETGAKPSNSFVIGKTEFE